MADPGAVSPAPVPRPGPQIFLSYRREDSGGHTGRISDRLHAAFGESAVFHDVDSIRAGEDFVEAIERTVGNCSAVVVVIGRQWSTIRGSSGQQRLDDSEDFVRLEVVAALERAVTLIPVLVGGAAMPRPDQLPEPLRPLTRHHSIEIRDTRFDSDAAQLIAALERATGLEAAAPSLRDSLRRRLLASPLMVVQGLLFLAALAIPYLIPPPADLTNDASRASLPIAGIVGVLAGSFWALLEGRPRGPSAARFARIAAMLCLLAAAVAAIGYQFVSARATVAYAGMQVVIGSGDQMTPAGRAYLETPEITLEQMVEDAAGEVELLWSLDSLRRNTLVLRVLYTLTLAGFLAAVLALLQSRRMS